MHYGQGRHLFGEEEHTLPLPRSGCNDVRDRLALASAWWPLDDEVAAGTNLLNHLGLRGVRVDDMKELLGRQHVVEPVRRTEHAFLALEAFVEQATGEGVVGQSAVGPHAEIQI